MATAENYAERLGRLDRTLEDLQRGLVEAIEQLRESPEAGGSFEERWADISARLKDLRYGYQAEDFDREQLAIVTASLLDIRDELEGQAWDLDVCDRLMISLERIRHVVRDATDEHVDGTPEDSQRLLEDLDRWLPDVPDHVIARFIGVDRRTLSRWRRTGGRPRRTLRLFARLVAILRHNWDEEGIVAWFDRARRDLGGRRPAALIDDPGAEEELIGAARAGRSQYAS